MDVYEVGAHNTSRDSDNKIHDDTVARRYGFAGGLVPGVDLYAYMTHVPAEHWGLDWLSRGSMEARFTSPVYEGDVVRVVPSSPRRVNGTTTITLELRNASDLCCAAGEARLPDEAPEPPDLRRWPVVEQASAADLAAVTPELLAPGTAFGLDLHGVRAASAGGYLADIREQLPLYDEQGVAHPGWLLRDANFVLSRNVRLGPWIHVSSATQHHGVAHDGDRVGTRAIVTKEWERKGHRFVELDVLLHTDAERVLARVTHIAIYRPRERDSTEAPPQGREGN
jgi:hypothetical protein